MIILSNFMNFLINVLVNGTIQLRGYENGMTETWLVEADCEQVNIRSTKFLTEKGYDVVTITDERYSHSYSGKLFVNQDVSSTFSIEFKSDPVKTKDGFVLKWNCFKTYSETTGSYPDAFFPETTETYLETYTDTNSETFSETTEKYSN